MQRPKCKNCPHSKIAQIQKLPKFKIYPNSKIAQIQKLPKFQFPGPAMLTGRNNHTPAEQIHH